MPQAYLVVLYNHPKDPAAFEKYYADTHGPLVYKHQKEIGFTRAIFVKFTKNLDGSPPAFYRKAELWFDSMEALDKATTTPGFATVAGDIPNFATGGFTPLAAQQTN